MDKNTEFEIAVEKYLDYKHKFNELENKLDKYKQPQRQQSQRIYNITFQTYRGTY